MINSNTVIKVLQAGESDKIEFKESFGREVLETLCAFANTKGGTLLIGVKDKGMATGLSIEQHILRDWVNQIDQSAGLQPSIKKVRVKGKELVLIKVDEGRIKPVPFRGRAYRRVGSTTRQMGVEELTRLILESAGTTWDELPEPRAQWRDIDSAKVKTFIRLANDVGRRPIPKDISVRQLLEKLDLVQKNKLTRAAVLLFGKQPQKFYPQAVLKTGRFKSDTLIVDDREIENTLFDQVEGAMSYFRERLQTRFEMTEKPQRRVIWEYPLEVLREAVVNAICHRDYMDNGQTQVRIYDNRLIVWNPGNLPDGLSVEMLKKEHRSIPRNRLIAKIFFYTGLIEQWGGGVVKMIQVSKVAGLPEPIFEEKGGFRVIFSSAPQATPHVGGALTEVEAKVLKFCKKPRSRAEIVKITNLSLDYVRKELLPKLIRSGRLSYTLPHTPRSPKQKYVTSKLKGQK